MIITRKELIEQLVSIQPDSDALKNARPEIKEKVLASVRATMIKAIEYYYSLSDVELIRKYRHLKTSLDYGLAINDRREHHSISLKLFAPGKFIFTDDIRRFVCQNL